MVHGFATIVVFLANLERAIRDDRTACVLLTDFDIGLIAYAQGMTSMGAKPYSEEELFSLLGDDLSDDYALVRIVPNLGELHDNLCILARQS